MFVLYAAAGITLAADREVHGLAREAARRTPDVIVHTHRPPSWQTDAREPFYVDHTPGAPLAFLTVVRSSDGLRFDYADETTFWIDRGARTVWMQWQGDFADACTYLVGPILGFVLRLRGEFALHASAVDVGGAAVGIAGPHGAGKSTAAAALGRCGYPILTDDILRLTLDEGRWHAHACGSILRLWPEGAALACGADARLPRITPSWDKRALAIGGEGARAASLCLPLSAIVFLADTATIDAPPRRLPPATAAIHLAANATAGYLLDAVGREREFAQLSALAADIPCVAAARPQLTGGGIGSFIDNVRAIATAAAMTV